MTPPPARLDNEHAEAVAATVAHIRGVLTALETVEYGEIAPAFSFAAHADLRNGRFDASS
jgi:hypothetical protein